MKKHLKMMGILVIICSLVLMGCDADDISTDEVTGPGAVNGDSESPETEDVTSPGEEYDIVFAVPDFSPYTYPDESGNLAGVGVEIIGKVLDELGVSYKLLLVSNHGRALNDTIAGDADGFFLASQNDERDDVARFSDTVMINNWNWFLPAGSDLDPHHESFRENAAVGSIINTNTEKWLTDNGYSVSVTPSDPVSCVDVLLEERADAMFMAELVFLQGVEEHEEAEEADFISIIEQGTPFGIYISNKYLDDNPDFMDRINDAIANL